MYRLIACDLDETLLNSAHVIPRRNLEAIRQAAALGVRFVPATGRGFCSVRTLLDAMGVREKAGEYVISFNGGAVSENRGERLLYLKAMPFSLAEELFRRGAEWDAGVRVYTRDTIYAYRVEEEERAYLAGRIDYQEFFRPDLDFLRGQEIIKVLYANRDREFLNRLRRELSDLEDRLTISFSSNRYMEFNPKGVDKGAGLTALAEALGVPMEETLAIGDNFNDLSMLQAAGLGACVKNAVPEVKAVCGYVSPDDNNQGAVAEIIERFVL